MPHHDLTIIARGIRRKLIEPAHPEQHGSHERMHRTLKRETTRPVKGSLAAQHVCFNRFRVEYNDERLHEALGQVTPASRYRASVRVLPKKLPELEYPAHREVRYVSANGGIRLDVC